MDEQYLIDIAYSEAKIKKWARKAKETMHQPSCPNCGGIKVSTTRRVSGRIEAQCRHCHIFYPIADNIVADSSAIDGGLTESTKLRETVLDEMDLIAGCDDVMYQQLCDLIAFWSFDDDHIPTEAQFWVIFQHHKNLRSGQDKLYVKQVTE